MDNSVIFDYTFDDKVIQAAEDVYPILLPKEISRDARRDSSHSVTLGPSDNIQADISDVTSDTINQFHVHIIFNLNAKFNGSQVLAECNKIPFKVELIGDGSTVKLAASIRSASVDWRGARAWKWQIRPGMWHCADIVYDGDTLTIFQDHHIVSFHSFGAAGHLEVEPYAHSVLIGGRNTTSFDGRIAKFKLSTDIPKTLYSQTTHLKSSPKWYMLTKLEMLRNFYDLGEETSDITELPRISSWWQSYTNGALMYHSGEAFALYGEILKRYESLSQSKKEDLGHLESDEQPLSRPAGRKSLFQGGAIYFSKTTGAFEVTGPIFHAFEAKDGTRRWGFPLDAALPSTNGVFQKFEKGTWYYKFGAPKAYPLEGEILKTFVSTGGLPRWGYPISNETPVPTNGPHGREIRLSECENGSFYWNPLTGAHAVEGDIREKWRELGGSEMHYIQELGLPTTEEMDVPNRRGARMSGFEQGVVIWYGKREDMIVVYPFKVVVRAVEIVLATTSKKYVGNKGHGGVYLNVILNRGDETVFFHRYPDGHGTAFSGADLLDLNLELPPIVKPEPEVATRITVDVWQEGEPHVSLGRWVQVLDATNAWGFASNGKLKGGEGRVKMEAEVRPLVEYMYY